MTMGIYMRLIEQIRRYDAELTATGESASGLDYVRLVDIIGRVVSGDIKGASKIHPTNYVKPNDHQIEP